MLHMLENVAEYFNRFNKYGVAGDVAETLVICQRCSSTVKTEMTDCQLWLSKKAGKGITLKR